MDPQQLSDVEAWVDAYGSATHDLEAGTLAAVWAAYAAVGDWYDPRQTVAAAGDAAQAVARMLSAVDGLVSAFQGNVVSILTGRPVSRLGSPRLAYPRADVAPRAVYDRPVWTYRDTVARGGTESEAFIAARLHAELLAGTDAMLAQRDATLITLKRHAVKAYRRVLRPELSVSGACGLCVAASQQKYSVADLLPIHERCKCAVLPIVQDNDPAAAMNTIDIAQLNADADGKSRSDLARTRYRVDEHGELGPVLVSRKAKPVAATAAWDDPARAQKELDALLPVLASLEARSAAGENVTGPLEYQRNRIAKLRSLVAA